MSHQWRKQLTNQGNNREPEPSQHTTLTPKWCVNDDEHCNWCSTATVFLTQWFQSDRLVDATVRNVNDYFACGSGCEVMWWVCLCVCVSMSVCLSMRISPEPHTQSLPNSRCCLWPWLGPPLVGWRNPMGRVNFRGFLPHWQCIVHHSIWDPPQVKSDICDCFVLTVISNVWTLIKRTRFWYWYWR